MNKYALAYGYKFEFKRFEINNFSEQDIYKYIVQINILNNLNITLYSFKLNINDCIRIIDEITKTMYDFYGLGGKCSITIQTGINTSTTINFSNFEHVDQTKKEFQNESFGELRECCLTFFDNNDNNTVQIAKIPISISELEEFIFELYFNTIIDLVLNEEQSEYVNEIIGRVFGSNWFNAG